MPSAFNLQTNIRIKEGDDLDLACPFDNFNEILWLLNNNSINIMEHKLIDRKLFIHNINGEHEGMWTCIAINTAGNSSFSYNINVLASPTIFASWNLHGRGISDFLVTESDIDERTFKRGEKLMLNCTSIGLPRPKIIWKKSTDIIGRGEVLTIDNLQFHHRYEIFPEGLFVNNVTVNDVMFERLKNILKYQYFFFLYKVIFTHVLQKTYKGV